ncbi:MAG: N-acetylglucosamine-6-phosphate deacetylase [Chloroflexi bacterium]|nr:N-acetylglucosamine-6-phosphate deacetylase [Chloroflexota bacterium]
MRDLLIINATAGEHTRGWMLCQDGSIAAFGLDSAPTMSDVDILDATGQWVLPGMIDVHVHGGAGFDTMDATRDALVGMARFHASHGVTGFLATTWTDTRPRITAALENIRANLGRLPGGATLLGAHLEGPYLNRRRGGAQNLEAIRRADPNEAMEWLDTRVIRIVSLAPEFAENHWLIEECVRRGIIVSAAHTDATYEQTIKGIDLGITHSTHTYNAMSPLNHREPGVVGAMMSDSRVRCELIADNIHIHPVAGRILWQAVGLERIVLISDAIRAAGMPDGEYPVDDRTIYVRGGVARLADGTLAGSTLTLDRGLFNFSKTTGLSLPEAGTVLSRVQALVAGVSARKGSLDIGKDADLVVIDEAGKVHATIIGGEVVYRA